MNQTTPLKKKWLVLAAVMIMLLFTLKDLDFSDLKKLSFEDVLPIIVLTALIFLFKTSILSAILIGVQKIWKKLNRGERK